jgi:hypothetical protein
MPGALSARIQHGRFCLSERSRTGPNILDKSECSRQSKRSTRVRRFYGALGSLTATPTCYKINKAEYVKRIEKDAVRPARGKTIIEKHIWSPVGVSFQVVDFLWMALYMHNPWLSNKTNYSAQFFFARSVLPSYVIGGTARKMQLDPRLYITGVNDW